MAPDEILRKAAEIVRQGWTRGRLAESDPLEGDKYCAVGAMRMAEYGSISCGENAEARKALIAYLKANSATPLAYANTAQETVTRWNDTVAKDAEEVATVLEKAAAEIS